MPELPDHMAYGGPGTAMSGPIVGALVPFVVTRSTITSPTATGAGEFGFRCPCDLVVESISWAAMTYAGASSTLAAYRHTDVNGATGGTLVMSAQAFTASGSVEGAGFASTAARKITKGQFLVFDPVIATSAPVNVVITVMAYVVGHAVADVAARS